MNKESITFTSFVCLIIVEWKEFISGRTHLPLINFQKSIIIKVFTKRQDEHRYFASLLTFSVFCLTIGKHHNESDKYS